LLDVFYAVVYVCFSRYLIHRFILAKGLGKEDEAVVEATIRLN
jgi:hypothetical protein